MSFLFVVLVPYLSTFWLCSKCCTQLVKILQHGFGVMYSVVGSIVCFGSLFVGFAPVGFEVRRGDLVVVVVDEVSEDSMEGLGFVGEGDVGAMTLAISSGTIGEEHDSDKMGDVRFDVGIIEELGNLNGKGEG